MNKKIVIFIVFVLMLLFTGKVSPVSEKNSIPESGAAAETYNIDGLWTFNIYRTSLGITEVCDATILGGDNKFIYALSKNWESGFQGFSGTCNVQGDNIEITAEGDIILTAIGKAANADSMSGTWSLSNGSDSGTWTAARNSQSPSPDFDIRGMWIWTKEEANVPCAWPLLFYGQKEAGTCKCADLIVPGLFSIIFPEDGTYIVSNNQVTANFNYMCINLDGYFQKLELSPIEITGNIVNGNLVEGTTDKGDTSLMLLLAKPGNNPPFGAFETPAEGTSVSGSIAVTGWALADRGVKKVEIFLLVDGNGVYIGDALLIDGARPDIESAYPHYPLNTRAGWGYMLLTNFLPGGGNGTYILEAVAFDYLENSSSLGTKTIYCDNANAVKPFGAIDSPIPGDIVSGSQYKNNGWVLTPPPDNIAGGTSINVYVDGKYLGHPSYGIYRPDIESLFPGYTNSSAAGCSYTLDTTAFQNGLHTIYWTARDSSGHEEGIGSRYFIVDNTAPDHDDHPAHWILGKEIFRWWED